MCWSTGRKPKAHPPGMETCPSPARARRAPQTMKLARIWPTSS